jgi:hypothetical protein
MTYILEQVNVDIIKLKSNSRIAGLSLARQDDYYWASGPGRSCLEMVWPPGSFSIVAYSNIPLEFSKIRGGNSAGPVVWGAQGDLKIPT